MLCLAVSGDHLDIAPVARKIAAALSAKNLCERLLSRIQRAGIGDVAERCRPCYLSAGADQNVVVARLPGDGDDSFNLCRMDPDRVVAPTAFKCDTFKPGILVQDGRLYQRAQHDLLVRRRNRIIGGGAQHRQPVSVERIAGIADRYRTAQVIAHLNEIEIVAIAPIDAQAIKRHRLNREGIG